MPLKPIKIGVKVWCLCAASSGYLFIFDIYGGKEFTDKNDAGDDSFIINLLVNKIMLPIIQWVGCVILMDNFFTSVTLAYRYACK